jgi:hypothetical protein
MDLLEARALAEGHAGSRHPWERARLNVVVNLLESRRLVGPDSIVLDVGCGDTFVADSLARHWPGARVAAVDPAFDERTLRHYRDLGARSGVSVHTHCGDLPDEIRRNTGLVLLMDVIEHVPDDVALVRGLLDDGVIGPGTKVLVTVPAYQALFSSHDVQLKHYRRYSRRSLRDALSRAGLRVNECGAFFVSLLPLRVAQMVRERFTRTADGPPGLASWSGGETAGRLLAGGLYLDARAAIALQRVGVPLPGLSLYALCERAG